MQPPGLYIHVPYCRVACPYCDFVKRPVEGDAPDRFTEAVVREIAAAEGPRQASTIFFGGGTPSLLSAACLERIFTALRDRFAITGDEVSFEVNPDDVTPERIALWKDLGITRLNLGVQSFDNGVLKTLGRCHDSANARAACALVAEAFGNWGLDLIFGAQPIAAWGDSLAEAKRFAPPHLSTYSLTYEERTPFWAQRQNAIDEDTAIALYRQAMDTLTEYEHYEVSNFAKPGFASTHNRIYWRNEEYLGFGPGAYSYLDGVRMRNQPRILAYLESPCEKVERLALSTWEVRVETLIQHFRTRSGIARDYYANRFGSSIADDFGDALAGVTRRRLLEETDGTICPTRLGYELNDEIGLALLEVLPEGSH